MKVPSEQLTPKKIAEIQALLASGLYHQHKIAAIVRVNQGRVSEIKHGKYH